MTEYIDINTGNRVLKTGRYYKRSGKQVSNIYVEVVNKSSFFGLLTNRRFVVHCDIVAIEEEGDAETKD